MKRKVKKIFLTEKDNYPGWITWFQRGLLTLQKRHQQCLSLHLPPVVTIISLQELRVFFWDRHCDKSSGFDSSKPATATHLSLNSSTNPWPCANISSRDCRQSCWSLHWVFLESVYLIGGRPRNKIGSPLWQRHEERSKRLELWCGVRCRPEPKLRESKKSNFGQN